MRIVEGQADGVVPWPLTKAPLLNMGQWGNAELRHCHLPLLQQPACIHYVPFLVSQSFLQPSHTTKNESKNPKCTSIDCIAGERHDETISGWASVA